MFSPGLWHTPCDGSKSFIVDRDLMDPTLPLKILDGFAHFASSELLDYPLQLRIFLAHDLLELHSLHACVLELRERPPGLDRFMLPTVADQKHAVIRMETIQKVMHLPG